MTIMDGGGAIPENDAFETIELDRLEDLQRYKLFMGSVVPRPIAFVSSLGPNGVVNAAPFSSLVSLSAVSSLIGFSIDKGKRGEKDTLKNIRAHGEFVINTVPRALAHQVQKCGEPFAPEVSELDQVGLTTEPSHVIKTPRIAETNIQFECRLHSLTDFEAGILVAGRVVMMHARRGIVADHKVGLSAYSPLGRIGGRAYCEIGTIINT